MHYTNAPLYNARHVPLSQSVILSVLLKQSIRHLKYQDWDS